MKIYRAESGRGDDLVVWMHSTKILFFAQCLSIRHQEQAIMNHRALD